MAYSLGLVALAGVLALSSQIEAQERVDFFDLRGNRTGYAIVDRETGRVDFYDRFSNRTGYGKVDRWGRTERFDLRGRRQEDTVLPLTPRSGDRESR